MRPSLTTFLTAVLVLLVGFARDARAQWTMEEAPVVPHIFMFESFMEDTSFVNAQYVTSEDTLNEFFEFAELVPELGVEPQEGAGAMVVNWGIKSDQSYGASMAFSHVLPDNYLPDSTDRLYDLSDFTELRFWYNTLVPAEHAGDLSLRVKLADASLGLGTAPNDETEDWTAQPAGSPLGAAAGWTEVVLPLENVGIGSNPTATGFTRPGCAPGGVPEEASGCWSGLLGNEKFDLDMISGFQFEFFAGNGLKTSDPDSLDAGVIAFDNLRVSGVRYDLLGSFDGADTFGGWDNGTASTTRTYTEADSVQGTGALEFAYDVTGTESWGGSSDVEIVAPETGFPDMTERSAISLFYKVVEPLTGNGRFVLKVFDNSTGTESEEWQYTADILTEGSGHWRRLLVPFEAFTLPSWVAQGDGVLNRDAIEGIQFQVFVDAGATAQGTLLVDRVTSYGVANVDTEAPGAVTSLAAAPSPLFDYENTVTWDPLDGEEGETYDVFYAFSPITDLEAEGVLLAAAGLSEDATTYQHRIFYPVQDGELTYYYAVRATDAAGNVSQELAATLEGTTNTGMGIPTISMVAPSKFAADGDLGDWAGIAPFRLDADGVGLGHAPAETSDGIELGIDDASDLSADVYLAMDGEAIYFALDVTDDVFVPRPDGSDDDGWLFDGAEIYIGLYDENETGPRHTGSLAGAEPDYKFYVYPQVLNSDYADVLLEPGESYYFEGTGDGSYVVEGRLPFATLIREDDAPFTPEEGMRIPLDIAIMDNDEANSVNREGILTYSFWNEDNAHNNPRAWFYTWVGNAINTAVEQGPDGLPTRFALEQNYPNPFNPTTTFEYSLPQTQHVTVRVYNLLGQQVRLLVDDPMPAGTHQVTFDARGLSSGVYFYQIQAGRFVQTKKMTLLR